MWVVCLQIHLRAGYDKREICLMRDAMQSEAECIKNNFEFIISAASGCICKQTTNWK